MIGKWIPPGVRPVVRPRQPSRRTEPGLDARQSAALAAVLPNPRRYRVEAPTPYQQRRRAWIERQAVQLGGPAWLAECCGIGESSR